MGTIGLRELTHHTAAIARRVREGETVVVTDHGRPVIRMTPVSPVDSLITSLAAAGRLLPARTPGYLPEPVDTRAWSGEDSTEIISELRDERL